MDDQQQDQPQEPGHDGRSSDDDHERDPFLPPTPTVSTVGRAAWATGVGAGLLLLGVLALRFVVCGDGTCPTGPARTAAEATATLGFLVVLVGAAYGLTAQAHLTFSARARRRRGEGDVDD